MGFEPTEVLPSTVFGTVAFDLSANPLRWCRSRESNPATRKLRIYSPGCLHNSVERHGLERATGVEPASEAWKAPVLPLNHARMDAERRSCTGLARLMRPHWILTHRPQPLSNVGATLIDRLSEHPILVTVATYSRLRVSAVVGTMPVLGVSPSLFTEFRLYRKLGFPIFFRLLARYRLHVPCPPGGLAEDGHYQWVLKPNLLRPATDVGGCATELKAGLSAS